MSKTNKTNKTNKININDEIQPLIVDYQNATEQHEKDVIFEQILHLCKPLIHNAIEKVIYKGPITYSDLESECYIVLFNVVRKYEKSDIAFSTYFINQCRFQLIKYIRKNQNALNVSHNQFERCAKIDNGETFKDSKDEMYYRNAKSGLNYDSIYELDSESLGESPEDQIDEGVTFKNDMLEEAFQTLSEKQQIFLKGLMEYDMDFTAYGNAIGRSRQAVYDRYNTIVNKLKQEML